MTGMPVMENFRKLPGDVPRPVEVCIQGKMAGMTLKMALVLAVALAGIPALGTPSTRIPRINLLDSYPGEPRLVINELEQPGEAPPVHPAVLLLALVPATSFPNVLQVLEYQDGSRWDRVHDPLGEDVVAVRAKPIDLPAKPLQHPPGGLGAFALQDPPVRIRLSLLVSPSLLPQELVERPVRVGYDCRSLDAQINPVSLAVGDERLALALQDHMQEQPVFPVPQQVGRADLPVFITAEIGWDVELDFLATGHGGQGSPSLFDFDHCRSFIVIPDSLPVGLGAPVCFGLELVRVFGDQVVPFPLECPTGSQGLPRFGKYGTDELGGELGKLALVSIIGLVDDDGVACLVGEPKPGGPVECLGGLGNGFPEGLGGMTQHL